MKIRCSILSALILAVLPPAVSCAFERPGFDPMSGRPATSPVDTRIYGTDGIFRTMTPGGQILSQTPSQDIPDQLRAAISPARIVFFDPPSGTMLGEARFVDMSYLFGQPWRQYQVPDGTSYLVDREAHIRKVVRNPDGNFTAIDLTEDGQDEGVGRSTTRYVRYLWADRTIPVFTIHSTPVPRTDTPLFEIKWPQGGGAPQWQ